MTPPTHAPIDGDVSADWTDVIGFDDLQPGRGVAALVDAEPVALFRVADAVYAIDHRDPYTAALVNARGLIASVGERLVIVTPLHKHRFDLTTGVGIDDTETHLAVWPTVVTDGRVLVGRRPRP